MDLVLSISIIIVLIFLEVGSMYGCNLIPCEKVEDVEDHFSNGTTTGDFDQLLCSGLT